MRLPGTAVHADRGRAFARRADAVITSEPQARLLAALVSDPRPAVVVNAVDPLTTRCKRNSPRGCTLVHIGEITDRGRALSETLHALALLPDVITLAFLVGGPIRRGWSGWPVARRGRARDVLPAGFAGRRADGGARAALALQRADCLNSRAGAPNKFTRRLRPGCRLSRRTRPICGGWCGAGMSVRSDARDPQAIAAAIRESARSGAAGVPGKRPPRPAGSRGSAGGTAARSIGRCGKP